MENEKRRHNKWILIGVFTLFIATLVASYFISGLSLNKTDARKAVVNGASIKGVSALQYINWELAQIICSDAHSMENRPPNTKAAYRLVEKKLGEGYADWLQKNSLSIFQNRLFDMPVINKPKKFLGRWR